MQNIWKERIYAAMQRSITVGAVTAPAIFINTECCIDTRKLVIPSLHSLHQLKAVYHQLHSNCISSSSASLYILLRLSLSNFQAFLPFRR